MRIASIMRSLLFGVIAFSANAALASSCDYGDFKKVTPRPEPSNITISINHYWPENRPVRLYAEPTNQNFYNMYKNGIKQAADQIDRKSYFGGLDVSSDIYFIAIDTDGPIPNTAMQALKVFSGEDEELYEKIQQAMSDEKQEIRIWWRTPQSIDLMRLTSKDVAVFLSKFIVWKTRTDAFSLKALGTAILLSFISLDDLNIVSECADYTGILSGAIPPELKIEDDFALLRGIYGVKK